MIEFRRHFESNILEWRSYYDQKEPHNAMIPMPWQEKLNEFQRLMVLRCLRTDKVNVHDDIIIIIHTCNHVYIYSTCNS